MPITSKSKFRKFNFKLYERLDTIRFVRLHHGKQLLFGHYDSLTKKGSGIKRYFEANLHIEFANGTDEECLAYTGKDYNRCDNPEHNPNPKKDQKCKYPKVAGSFDFSYDESKFEKEPKENELKTNKFETIKFRQVDNNDAYDKAIDELKQGQGKNLNEVIKFASRCKKWSHSAQGMKILAEAFKTEDMNPLKDISRY
ncbi:hypothetical protein C2G38_2171101 [Gigaspora rosea]|uniref:Uncharacterized protein n=1 Tax=Gigaspora rosea TaxID=44941 RepID=A0A397VR71_9GLOM|nr:hypothetical protein C2G38_2234553 [Gigaspora rosea]RIB23509.1 hypothetical protein C2G38_2171101 [Gigaspora rosea]